MSNAKILLDTNIVSYLFNHPTTSLTADDNH